MAPVVKEDVHFRLAKDLNFFARNALQIKTAAGNMELFEFNRTQLYVHALLEEQLAKTGMVRALILKGRQQGVSTYVAARFLHKALWNRAKSVFILTHLSSATANLFELVKRYYDHLPTFLKPETKISNQRNMQFANGSDYKVATAGEESTGRSMTAQFFHGSEVAFYTNADSVQTGAMQTVSDVPGTEIILESTANGMAGLFYQMCMDAVKGEDPRWQLIFCPWFWKSENAAEIPPSFSPLKLSEYEKELQERHNLTQEQLFWRRLKLRELKSDWKFRQEYPSTIQEAFVSSVESLVDGEALERAKGRKVPRDMSAPLVMAVDVAISNDRCVFLYRRGRMVEEVIKVQVKTTMELVGRIVQELAQKKPDKCFVDKTGIGYGVVDRLMELGYRNTVVGVNFGSSAMDPNKFLNKRAEMFHLMKVWIEEDDGCLPDNEEVMLDLSSLPRMVPTSAGKDKMQPKEDIKKVLGRSTDIADALALTFAFPVRSAMINSEELSNNAHNQRYKKNSASRTINRLRLSGR